MQTGYVDVAQPDKLEGWAADEAAPDEVLEVTITVDGREAARVRADLPRHDLQRLGKFGDGRHGFRHNFAPPLDPAGEHTIVVRIAGSGTLLNRGAFRIRPARNPPAPAPALPPPRYVVHVGMPKTGTKYLQHNFTRHRDRLLAEGILYPSKWWPEKAIVTHEQLAEDLRHGPTPQVAEVMSQLNRSGSRIVLLSSEGFNPVPAGSLEALRDMAGGAPVEIVFYARRWSDWIPSQWQQAVKQGSVETFPEWYVRLLGNADTHPGINQALFLDKFSKVFGRQNIRLVSYSNLQDRNVDLFDHFCRSILGLPAGSPIKGTGNIVHESMGAVLTELVRVLNVRQAIGAGKPGYHVFEAYHRTRNEPAVADASAAIARAMARHMAEIPLDDGCYQLRPIYERLNDYRDRLVTPEYGDSVFEQRRGQCRYVRPDYLMEDGVLPAVDRIAAAVQEHLARGKPQQAVA